MHRITVAIITYQRQSLLRQSLEALVQIAIPDHTQVDLLVVDNDSAQSARMLVEEIALNCQISIMYAVEPMRGRSYARNRVLDMTCSSDYVAFIDDDVIVAPTWLEELYHSIRQTNAQFISGRIVYHLPDDAPSWTAHCQLFAVNFSITGTSLRSANTGNLLMDAAWVRHHHLRFQHLILAEDMVFTTEAFAEGALILSHSEPLAKSIVIDKRLNLQWVWRRCFNNGMARAGMALRADKTITGYYSCVRQVLKLGWFAAGALVLFLFRRRHWIRGFEHTSMAVGFVVGMGGMHVTAERYC